MKKIGFVAASLAVVLSLSCSQVPLTGRNQLSLVNDSELENAAVQQYNQFLSENKGKIISSGNNAQMVSRVGQRIANAVTKYMNSQGLGSRVKDYKWQFTLIQNDEKNAWCMPGGKVAVYSGILPVTQTEAGLAVVMGHEIAHAVARHSNERYSQAMVAQGVGAVAGAAVTKSQAGQQVFQQLYGIGAQGAVLLPNSRRQESEADRLGLIFMAIAGYDPDVAVSFWQRMAASKGEGNAPPEFLSTHPSDQRRISDIQARLPEAKKYYTSN
ncbi:MAG: M48 family metallopeptidase [Mucilaginibacter polytrichastri]|nr:M48 family metallopeptidase [Mucilaginibacter polytrichastri]